MTGTAVIVTGLPASGKSTLARALGRALQWPVLDKDDFLEDLFALHDTVTPEKRRSLSREADEAFRVAAKGFEQVILVSHWRPRTGPDGTGTATGWLDTAFDRVIEVHCDCPPERAARQFRNRRRHPGHLDHLKSYDDITRQMAELSNGFPLNPSTAFTIPSMAGDGLNECVTHLIDRILR
ncbi:MAG: AAA family ATPase [Albidovulum sp.]|uniref:AAA family ATPase n=1 Tax=Albidovulum sp. TaxID=1872424 RepID=UPI003C896CD0